MPVNLPNGIDASEIVLPNGNTASEVIGPDGNVLFSAGGGYITPDSVVSRPSDDLTTDFSGSIGLVINPNNNLAKVGFRISQDTTGITRARVYDYSQSQYVFSKDISSKTSGDAVALDIQLDSGIDYGIELDDSGSSFTAGIANQDLTTVSGSDLDIVARSIDGSTDTTNYATVNDIGNPDGILN